jgi:hypothetical protein
MGWSGTRRARQEPVRGQRCQIFADYLQFDLWDARRLPQPLHFGDYGGLPLKTLSGLLSSPRSSC